MVEEMLAAESDGGDINLTAPKSHIQTTNEFQNSLLTPEPASGDTSRRQSKSAFGTGKSASRKARYDRGQRSSGVRRGHLLFR